MSPMSRLHETRVELEVPLHDVDVLGVVWHGHYFKYFEAARSRLLRDRGLDLDDMAALRLLFFVIDSHCRHSHPLFYGDRMCVSAWVKDTRHRIHIAYEIENMTSGLRAALGQSVVATTDVNRNLLIGTPDEICRRLA